MSLETTITRMVPELETDASSLTLEMSRAAPSTTDKTCYQQARRIQVKNFLTASTAADLRKALLDQTMWNLVFQLEGRHVDTDAAAFAAGSTEDRARVIAAIHADAADKFQYFFQTVPLYDLDRRGELPPGPLTAVMRFLQSEKFIEYARALCAAPEISFADAQATCYRPGHFLGRHDDNVAGKSRVAAYVLNLSDNWSPDWGGALQFFNGSGDVETAWQPRLNTLNVFQVPTDHSVSLVAPFAREPRLAITGWLRSGDDPDKRTAE